MNDILQTHACRDCGQAFGVTAADLTYYQRMDVPPPVRCPDCRQQLRLLHCNQIHLFKRLCDATGESIITNYPPECPHKVYSQRYWYSDKCDASEFGMPYDFSRPFFEQFLALKRAVPLPCLYTDYLRDENCAYTNYSGKNKDCYLIFDSDESRDCLYSYGINGSVSSADCYRGGKLELCCEVVDARDCYSCAYVYNSENCSDSCFLQNCIGCKKCFMCSNLKNKEYYYRNEAVSPQDFDALRAELGSYQKLQDHLSQFRDFACGFPQKYLHGFQNEDVSGDYLTNCKNAWHCFDCRQLWDGKYCFQGFMPAKDCMDVDEIGGAELAYETTSSGYNAYNLRFCVQCLEQVSNLTYCQLCFIGSSDLFGCVGLRRKHYCILNRQYTKTQYEDLVPRIVAHMQSTGEWGGFFPPAVSSFSYNLTKAMEWYPLSKAEALDKGFIWWDDAQREYQPQRYLVPDHIREVRDDALQQVLACTGCRKNYILVAPELAFYRKMGLPLPRLCFHCRHLDRLMQRNPRMLWDRACGSCGTALCTSYAPVRPEQVLCESCYLNSLG